VELDQSSRESFFFVIGRNDNRNRASQNEDL
jgi:hypothetical protein